MLDGLLGSGFKAKCKSVLKATRARVEVVRRRAEAKQRFLKDDLVKLLANGLDINAFGRTEEYLALQNLLASYDFIEQTCQYIAGQVSGMQKRRECPDECREAVGSLMFAAARFSDLPELRDVRDLFKERYGSSLECFVNQKFLEKLSSRNVRSERRIQLLQDIASEYSIKWDSKSFEQRLSNPSATEQSQANKHESSHVTASINNQMTIKNGAAKTDKGDLSNKGRPAVVNYSDRMSNRREGTFFMREDDPKRDRREGTFLRREDDPKSDRRDAAKQRPELNNGVDKLQNDKEGSLFGRKESHLSLYSIGKQDASSGSQKPIRKNDGRSPKGLNIDILSHDSLKVKAEKYRSSNEKDIKTGNSSQTERPKIVGTGYMLNNNGWDDFCMEESRDDLSYGKLENGPVCMRMPDNRQAASTPLNHINQRDVERSMRKLQGEERDRLCSYQNSALPPPYVKSKVSVIPPPYTKPKDDQHRSSSKSKHSCTDYEGPSIEPSPGKRVDAVDHSFRMHRQIDLTKHEGQNSELNSQTIYAPEEVLHNQDNMIPLPKPRSVRRKHHRSSSHLNEVFRSEDDGGATRRSSSSRRREQSEKGSQIFFDNKHYMKDDEENLIDKLLLHYSKKQPTYDIGNLRERSHAHPSYQRTTGAGESSRNQTRNGQDGESEYIPLPTRSVSLPREQSAPIEDIRVFTRANSFQLDNQALHVHPKLPDYDDLAARFATLKGQ